MKHVARGTGLRKQRRLRLETGNVLQRLKNFTEVYQWTKKMDLSANITRTLFLQRELNTLLFR